MSAVVAHIPTRLHAEQAWQSYRDLARQAIDEPALMADMDYCIRLAHAFDRWRDAFLALDVSAAA